MLPRLIRGCRLATPLLLLVALPGFAAVLQAAPPPAERAADATAGVAVPEAENRYVWEPRTESVSVFKNGLGFFTRAGSVQLREGWAYAREVPPAAFGTLAVYAHAEEQSVDLVGAGPGEVVVFDGHDAPDDADSKRERLESCLGLSVELHYERLETAKSAAGKLVAVGDQYVVLEGAETSAVPLDSIRELRILDMPLRVHVSQANGDDATEAQLGIAYLRKGIMWIPEYTLTILDEETAELTLRGTLVNEAEDLVHCDVNFVVGVPHFVHSELMSPIAVGRVLRTLGSGIPGGGVPPQVMTQMMNRAVITSNALSASQTGQGEEATLQPAPPESGDLSDVIGNLPQMESAATGDFTVYTKSNLTVRRGERAIVTLFTKKIRYQHRYRWETNADVQHFLTLENATNTAWTTGPCLTLSSGNPLSEDILKYTPRGGRGELQVTTAINIAHSQSEEEVDRQLKAHEPRNNEFLDLVTIAGELHLKNFEAKPVEIVVEAPIQGRPLEASHGGAIEIDVTKLRLIERVGSIRWRLSLAPGEETRLTYRYERYVPSN